MLVNIITIMFGLFCVILGLGILYFMVVIAARIQLIKQKEQENKQKNENIVRSNLTERG